MGRTYYGGSGLRRVSQGRNAAENAEGYKMKTALDKAREKLDKVCEELDCFGFGYMEDAPLKFVLRGGENQENVAVFIMDDDAKFKACYNWTADNEPDYEK